LTWIVYRALEGHGLGPQFCEDVLGLPEAKSVSAYYWQRQANSEGMDPAIDATLGEVEPWHTRHGRQRTETDLTLEAEDWLCLCEHKCGNPTDEPTGWRQSDRSPLVPEYEPHFRHLLRDPTSWDETGRRFAQLMKNLSLGVALARKLPGRRRPPRVHLAVLINDRVCGKDGATYRSEFDAFRGAVNHPAARLHLATWQQIRQWLGSRPEPLCRLACQAIDENDWL
jgi:hypothetical protein